MILADTSVWIDHFRRANPRMQQLLETGEVSTHPMVLGELACGNLRDRNLVLHYFENLPVAITVSDQMVLDMIERRKLWGAGIGWIDAHLLASSLVSRIALWTLDRRLAALSASFNSSAPDRIIQ